MTVTASQIAAIQVIMIPCTRSAALEEHNLQLTEGKGTPIPLMQNPHSKRSSSQPMEAATLAYREPTAATSHRGAIVIVMRSRIRAEGTIRGKDVPGAIKTICLIIKLTIWLGTDDQIRSAAKRRRVEVHPDKSIRPRMSESEMDEIDAEAARVGQASDVLLDPEQKLKYDSKLYAAKRLK